jgi:prepilin-type N-terminal cleavage/methylation domain-containing protein
MPHCTRCRRAAFSLVELAIVLAIIGILVGGIMVGTSLLRQSEMQALISDFGKYTKAVENFRQQYGNLPGDILDGTNYWGDDAAVCADAAVTNGSPGTCNGNSDGDLSTVAVVAAGICKLSDATTNAPCEEPYRAWQHLVLANMISGNFTGVASGGGAVPGTNVPKARLTNTGWSFMNNTAVINNVNWYNNDLSNLLALGAPIAAGATQGAALTAQEAVALDRKLDDGLPATGRVVALKPTPSTITPNCTNSATDATAAYNVTVDGKLCSLMMSLTTK